MFTKSNIKKSIVVGFKYSNLLSRIGVERWCDFGANLVQHFIGRYSRYSRYRTKSQDKATISHDITRYSRYPTVVLKLEEISYYFLYTKSSASAELFVLHS